MQKRRTQHFKMTLAIAGAFSMLIPAMIAAFGRQMTQADPNLAIGCIFAVLVLAAASYLTFSFLPYFRGDRRWYSISALLTVAFFAGAAILWQLPLGGMVAA